MKKNLLISIGAILFLIGLTAFITYRLSRCDSQYTQADVDAILGEQGAAKIAYEDSLDFVRGQAELQAGANLAHTERIIELEKTIDQLTAKHETTKKKIKPFYDTAGTQAMLVPPEYVDECETCFVKLTNYKYENIQLRFERDSYDEIMRNQNKINEDRVTQLEGEKLIFNKMFNDCQTARANDKNVTRKLKLSAMGQLNDLFLPRGGGPGLIYEDKKFNEYGAHVLFTNTGKMYLFNIAKTISFRRKK